MSDVIARLAIDDEDRVIPEVLVPVQLAASRVIAPERELIASVLADAVDCFQKHHGATARFQRRLFDDAEHWIFATGDDAPLSFDAVCEFLGLDADALRAGLRRWRERHVVDVGARRGMRSRERAQVGTLRAVA